MSNGDDRNPRRPLLPEPSVPFPVEVEYRVRPDLRRMRHEEGHFRLDSEWALYLTRKLDLLSHDSDRCRVLSRPPEELMAPVRAVARQVASEHPWLLSLEEGRISLLPMGVSLDAEGLLEAQPGGRLHVQDANLRDRLLAHLERVPPPERAIDLLALAVQEDLVILDGSEPGADEATLLHVCFPSRWDPGSRRGASFSQLHGPVPQSAGLRAASRNLVSAMAHKGPFERFVWSLTGSPDLDGHPDRVAAGVTEGPEGTPGARPDSTAATFPDAAPRMRSSLGGLYFRAERQTTRALGGGQALFTIRIHVAPLADVLLVPGRAEVLAAAVRGMSEELLAYKGLCRGSDELASQLDAFAAATRDRLPTHP